MVLEGACASLVAAIPLNEVITLGCGAKDVTILAAMRLWSLQPGIKVSQWHIFPWLSSHGKLARAIMPEYDTRSGYFVIYPDLVLAGKFGLRLTLRCRPCHINPGMPSRGHWHELLYQSPCR